MNIDKKSQFLSILRTLLTAAGSFFAGKLIFGQEVNNEVWIGISGAVVAIASTAWGIYDKTATVEMIESAGRSVLTAIGPLLVASGKLKGETLNFITLAFTTILPYIFSKASTEKNKQVATGKLAIADLKGVDEKKPENITPVISEVKK